MVAKAYDALAAEREAAEAEGKYAPTAEQMTALKRYRELRARVERDTTEMEAIESALKAEMDEIGARALVVNGKNWVLISDVNKTVVDRKAFEETFPELAAAYTTALAGFTHKVKTVGARTAVKPL